MTTEDDTFNALKRVSRQEMGTVMLHWIQTTDLTNWRDKVDAFMKPYGWTWNEYREIRYD